MDRGPRLYAERRNVDLPLLDHAPKEQLTPHNHLKPAMRRSPSGGDRITP